MTEVEQAVDGQDMIYSTTLNCGDIRTLRTIGKISYSDDLLANVISEELKHA